VTRRIIDAASVAAILAGTYLTDPALLLVLVGVVGLAAADRAERSRQ